MRHETMMQGLLTRIMRMVHRWELSALSGGTPLHSGRLVGGRIVEKLLHGNDSLVWMLSHIAYRGLKVKVHGENVAVVMLINKSL